MTKAKPRHRSGPVIRTWSRETITPNDWDFTELILKIEDEQRYHPKDLKGAVPYRALTWELDRELGSGNGPFLGNASWPLRPEHPPGSVLTLVAAHGERREVELEPPPWPEESLPVPVRLRAWPLGKFAGLLTPETRSAWYGLSSRIVALEIPLFEDEEELVESLRLFVRRHLQGQLSPKAGRPGRPREWRTSFDNLAVYRLSRCGYSYPEAQNILRSCAEARKQTLRKERQTLRKEVEAMVESAVKHFKRCPQDRQDPTFRFSYRSGVPGFHLENHARKVLRSRKGGQKVSALTDEQWADLFSDTKAALTDRKTLNAQEFSRATAKTEEAIRRRFRELRAWEEDWAKRLPKEPPRDWRDFFIKP